MRERRFAQVGSLFPSERYCQIPSKFSSELVDALDYYAASTGISRAALIRMIVEIFVFETFKLESVPSDVSCLKAHFLHIYHTFLLTSDRINDSCHIIV